MVAAFGTMVVLNGVVIAGRADTIRDRVREQQVSVAERAFARADRLQAVRLREETARATLLRIFEAEDEDARRALVEQVRAETTEADEAFGMLVELVRDDEELLEVLQPILVHRRQYRATLDAVVLPSIERGDLQTAAAWTFGVQEVRFRFLVEGARVLSDHARARALSSSPAS